jgi:glycosyltransferase involved in cell wall biosynthesis
LKTKLTLIIPCYNEEAFIGTVLERVWVAPLTLPVEKEIIVVDDGSNDGSSNAVENFTRQNPSANIRLIKHDKNKGKGACIASALTAASGDIILIQDADLEYNPDDYEKLLDPIVKGYADVVYGSRFRGSEAHRVLFFLHSAGNKFLTFISNIFTGLNLTDMETGYKMFKKDILKQVSLKEKRFGFEPEVTAKISRIKKIRIYEVGISYHGREYTDGKKIRWPDGFRAIYCIFKYNIFSRK